MLSTPVQYIWEDGTSRCLCCGGCWLGWRADWRRSPPTRTGEAIIIESGSILAFVLRCLPWWPPYEFACHVFDEMAISSPCYMSIHFSFYFIYNFRVPSADHPISQFCSVLGIGGTSFDSLLLNLISCYAIGSFQRVHTSVFYALSQITFLYMNLTLLILLGYYLNILS